MLTGVVLSFMAFAVFFFSCVLIFHFFPPRRRFFTMMFLALCALLAYACFYYISANTGISALINSRLPSKTADILCGLFIYSFIFAFYFQLVIIFDSSVTTRIMVELEESGGKGLTDEGIRKRYSLDDKFQDELRDMDYMRRIVKDGEFYKNTSKGVFHARVIGFLRDFLHVGGHQ